MSFSFLFGLFLFSDWSTHVEPVLSKPEKQAYAALRSDEERATFEEQFWRTKNISREEYDRRIAYVGSAFGGWRADRGRLYLSLGAPNKISRLSSTRSFWPVEIWYYSSAQTIGYSGAVQFLFFQRNHTGDYRLYSPTLDTFTALLNPQGGTRGMFRNNDILTEGDIRSNMNLTPAELELVDAALGVAKGVKGVENDAIISRASSPSEALSRNAKFAVSSRIVTTHPVVTTFQSWSEDGIANVDLSVETPIRHAIAVSVSTESTELSVTDSKMQRVRYEHRLALLPGTYTLTVTVDGVQSSYPLVVSLRNQVSEILLGETVTQSGSTPFQFGTVHLDPSANPTQALIQVPLGTTVTWRLRQNARTVWSATSKGPIGIVDLNAPAGVYDLEAKVGSEIRECLVELGPRPMTPVISYNANLSPADRARSIGRQWIARGDLGNARLLLERARSLQPSDAVTIDLARLSALAGDLDKPRQALVEILHRDPNDFEALTVMGFIEARLQDFPVAADYYRRALAIRRTPEVAQALDEAEKRR